MSAGARAMPPPVEADADLDRDDRGAERRGELEHERREERDPQRCHRLAPVGLGRLGDAVDLGGAAVERAQRRQSAHDARGSGCRAVPARRAAHAPGVRPRGRRGYPNTGISGSVAAMITADSASIERHPDQDRHRHDRGQDELGQVAGEVRVERVDPVDRRGRDVGRSIAPRRPFPSTPATSARRSCRVVAAAVRWPPASNAHASSPRASAAPARTMSGIASAARSRWPRKTRATTSPMSVAWTITTAAVASARTTHAPRNRRTAGDARIRRGSTGRMSSVARGRVRESAPGLPLRISIGLLIGPRSSRPTRWRNT